MNLTRISVDGLSDDWVGRAVIEGDPAGDSEAGFLDLTNGFAFVNEHALYLLVETVDRNAPFEQFEIYLRAGSRELWVGWAPQWDYAVVVDITTEWDEIGQATLSAFALGAAMEGRLDLRDLALPDSVTLSRIDVMAGECAAQHGAP